MEPVVLFIILIVGHGICDETTLILNSDVGYYHEISTTGPGVVNITTSNPSNIMILSDPMAYECGNVTECVGTFSYGCGGDHNYYIEIFTDYNSTEVRIFSYFGIECGLWDSYWLIISMTILSIPLVLTAVFLSCLAIHRYYKFSSILRKEELDLDS